MLVIKKKKEDEFKKCLEPKGKGTFHYQARCVKECHFGRQIADDSFSFISTMMLSKFIAHPRNKYISRALQINSNKVKGDGV